ncbi:uncharacterized protein LOC136028777 [Artemia franciscana]|uniref:uncharacterized protein LOC136028777 n=1 Tax=Artemia franciscana TaxID=6661 RepID=UPI0032DA6380
MPRQRTLSNTDTLEPDQDLMFARPEFWISNKTLSLPNLSVIDYELQEIIFESAITNAIRNLEYNTLYSLLKVPVIFNEELLIHGIIILLYGSFSLDILSKDYDYRHKNAAYTFAALLQAMPPVAYPLIASLIRENFWHIEQESGFKILWPLKFLDLLLNVNYKIVEDENILLGIYEHYLRYSTNFDPIIVKNSTHYIYDEQYMELINVTTKFYMNDENFGSKILPDKDIIVYEKFLDTASPLCFRKELIYKIIHTTSDELSLKDLCRKKIRQTLRKRDINYSIQSLHIPTFLKKYIMYMENGPGINEKDFQLTFKTPYLLKSAYNLMANSGPILRITENREIDGSFLPFTFFFPPPLCNFSNL